MTSHSDFQRSQEISETLRDLAWTVRRRVFETAETPDLPATELAMLKQLLSVPGATVGELAQRLSLRQSNASAAVRTLVERGFIRRDINATDRRVINLIPTDKALSRREAIADAWSGTIRTALAQLDTEDRAAIETAAPALARLTDTLRSTPK